MLRNARKGFGLLFAADRRLAIQLVVLTLADAVFPVAIAYVGKRIIDAVVAAVQDGTGATVPLLWVAVEAVLMVARASVGELTSAAQTRIRSALGLEVNTRILAKAINVSYRHFEDPHFNDQLAQARREASSRPIDVVRQVLLLVRNAVTLVGYGALLAGFSGFALLALLGSTIPPFIAEARFARRSFLKQRGTHLRQPPGELPRGAAVEGREHQGGQALLPERSAAAALPRDLRALPRRGQRPRARSRTLGRRCSAA